MDEIKLKIGGKEVTYSKLPEQFAVRLKRGRAIDESTLRSAAGEPHLEARHVDSVGPDDMEIFAVEEAEALEATTDELREGPGVDVVTHVYRMEDSPGGEVVPTGQMMVQFAPGVDRDEREEILSEHGLEILEEVDFVPNGYDVRLTEASTENPLKIAKRLQDRDEIEAAEPDFSFRVSRDFTPAGEMSLEYTPPDTLFPLQWHLKNRGDEDGLTAGADVKAEDAWDYTRGERDVVVCVTDDGFDLEHPDLDAPGKIVTPYDFGETDPDPSPVGEGDNHGTACAGVAVAEENGTGVVGLAPDCSFMPVRTSGWLSNDSVANLFQYAIDHGADVISCSWKATAQYFPLSTKMTAIIRKAATEGRDGKGCVILFAAGNDDLPLDGEADGNPVHQGFALHPNVIAVGASNSHDERSYYSNFGPELSLCAPSNGASWTPDGRTARPIVTTDRRGGAGYNKVGSLADYAYFGGTSSATPLAAGLAALILSLDPDLGSSKVKRIMMDTADKIDEERGEYADGHSPWYGHGRINARRAVELVDGSGEEQLPRSLSMEHRVNRPVPDRGEIEDAISFPMDVDSREIEVSVEIHHARRGDLRVSLTPPAGDELTLIEQSDSNRDDVVHTFRSDDDPDVFGDVLEASPAGDWRLRVMDMAEQETGTLVKWGLTITYE